MTKQIDHGSPQSDFSSADGRFPGNLTVREETYTIAPQFRFRQVAFHKWRVDQI
jgi:hypothetical protein